MNILNVYIFEVELLENDFSTWAGEISVYFVVIAGNQDLYLLTLTYGLR